MADCTFDDGGEVRFASAQAHDASPDVQTLSALSVTRELSLDALRPEWERLEERCDLRLPFAQPWWTEQWVHHLLQHRLAIADELVLLACRDGSGALRGVAPMVLTERPSVGWMRSRTLRMIGADPNITEVSGPVCAPEDRSNVITALLGYFRANASEWDILLFGGVQAGEASLLERWAGARWQQSKSDYYLELSGTWETFRSTRGRNLKESLRKCYNSLKRDGHAFDFSVVSEPEEIPAALETFFALHAARAALKDTIIHPNVFEHALPRAFIHSCFMAASVRHQARIFQLTVAGEVVATRLSFLLGDQLYMYFSGYSPQWKQYSIMTTLLAETIQWAFASNVKVLNLSPGTDVSKTRWAPRAVTFRDACLPSPSLRGRLMHRVYMSLTARETRVRRLLWFAQRYRPAEPAK